MYNRSTLIQELTVSEFQEVIRTTINESIQRPQREPVVHGIPGIALLFGVSYRQAQRIKDAEWFQPAVAQNGRTIVIDVETALLLWARQGRSSVEVR